MKSLKHKKIPGPKASESTKEKILESALHDFARQGLAGARVEQIAARAGVNKAMLYYHFNSKENLYASVLEWFFTNASSQLSQTISTPKDIRDLLERIAEFYNSLFSHNPEFRSIILRELAEPHSKIINSITGIISGSKVPVHMLDYFGELKKKGELKDVDIRQAIILFVTMNIGYFLASPLVDKIWKIENKEHFMKDRKKAIVDIFLRGILVD